MRRICITALERGVGELVKAQVDDGAVMDVGTLKGRRDFVAHRGTLDVWPQRVRGGSGHTMLAVVRSIGGSTVSKTLAKLRVPRVYSVTAAQACRLQVCGHGQRCQRKSS